MFRIKFIRAADSTVCFFENILSVVSPCYLLGKLTVIRRGVTLLNRLADSVDLYEKIFTTSRASFQPVLDPPPSH